MDGGRRIRVEDQENSPKVSTGPLARILNGLKKNEPVSRRPW